MLKPGDYGWDQPGSFDDRELRERIARIEKALGLGPLPPKPVSKRGTADSN